MAAATEHTATQALTTTTPGALSSQEELPFHSGLGLFSNACRFLGHPQELWARWGEGLCATLEAPDCPSELFRPLGASRQAGTARAEARG